MLLGVGGESHIYSDDNKLAVEERLSAILLKQRKKKASTQPGCAIVGHGSIKVPNADSNEYGNNWHWIGVP
jgi:hypothetical protein